MNTITRTMFAAGVAGALLLAAGGAHAEHRGQAAQPVALDRAGVASAAGQPAQLQSDKAAAEQRDDALAQLKAMQGQLAARGDSGAQAAAKRALAQERRREQDAKSLAKYKSSL